MDFNLPADIRRPDVVRWFRFAFRGYKKQDIATKLLWQESPHQTNAVVISLHDSFIVVFLQHGEEMFVMTQGVDHITYRISRAGEKNLFMAPVIAAMQEFFTIAGIAIEKGEQSNLFVCGLEVSGNGVSH
jgi:hypothetical protein